METPIADFVWATACLTLRRLAGQNFPLWTINWAVARNGCRCLHLNLAVAGFPGRAVELSHRRGSPASTAATRSGGVPSSIKAKNSAPVDGLVFVRSAVPPLSTRRAEGGADQGERVGFFPSELAGQGGGQGVHDVGEPG